MTEHKNNNEVTLNCSVTSYEKHRHTVEWLHVDHNVDTNNNDAKASKSDASASVTLTSLHQKSDHLEVFMCKVTDTYTKQVQLFTFSSQISGEKPGKSAVMSRVQSICPDVTTKTSNSTAQESQNMNILQIEETPFPALQQLC